MTEATEEEGREDEPPHDEASGDEAEREPELDADDDGDDDLSDDGEDDLSDDEDDDLSDDEDDDLSDDGEDDLSDDGEDDLSDDEDDDLSDDGEDDLSDDGEDDLSDDGEDDLSDDGDDDLSDDGEDDLSDDDREDAHDDADDDEADAGLDHDGAGDADHADGPIEVRARARKPKKKGKDSGLTAGPQRLQKLLAQAGYGSRRACEEYLLTGRVTVDGVVVRELGSKADPAVQDVRVDDERLRAEGLVYYLVNKPRGVVCTSNDPERRQTIVELVPQEKRRVFSVGRLDQESRGLVILTNDGRLTNLLTHPRYGVEKTYQVRVRGEIDDEALERLRTGVWLSEGRTLPAKVWVERKRRDESVLGLAICEGKNRQVRRMLAKVGYKVLGLTRTAIGPLTVKGLRDGGVRELRPFEVDRLLRLAQQNAQAPRTAPRARRSRARSLGKPDPAAPPLGPDAWRKELGLEVTDDSDAAGAPLPATRGRGREGGRGRDGAPRGRGRERADEGAPRERGRAGGARGRARDEGEGRGWRAAAGAGAPGRGRDGEGRGRGRDGEGRGRGRDGEGRGRGRDG
ncbi:MAG: pseudouridine synthase, partial [Planctomycetota bacterium]